MSCTFSNSELLINMDILQQSMEKNPVEVKY